MKEEGSVLLLALLAIIILLIFVTSLGYILIGELKMTDYYLKRVQADYKAEAAIAEAYCQIKQENSADIEKLKNISGSLTENNDFYIKEISFNQKYYQITSVGIAGRVRRKLTTCIYP